MLAAEFGYNWKYIDRYMDIPFFVEHMDYREKNPHVGALFQAYLKAQAKAVDNRKENPPPKTPSHRVKEPETSQSQYSNSLQDFLADWKDVGGVVK